VRCESELVGGAQPPEAGDREHAHTRLGGQLTGLPLAISPFGSFAPDVGHEPPSGGGVNGRAFHVFSDRAGTLGGAGGARIAVSSGAGLQPMMEVLDFVARPA